MASWTDKSLSNLGYLGLNPVTNDATVFCLFWQNENNEKKIFQDISRNLNTQTFLQMGLIPCTFLV
jgi:hypothetical protein